MSRAALVVAFVVAAFAPPSDRDLPAPVARTDPGAHEERREEIDRAVTRGLAWLADQQLACGGWAGDVGHKQEDSYLLFDRAESQREENRGHVGVAALAGLAFLASGHVPERGRYAANLDRTIDYLLRHQSDFGYMTDSGTRMYSHAFATLFLSQVHGMTTRRARDVEAALSSAARFIMDSQNAHGAWRYSPFTDEADLSVTVCQVQALRAAHNVGIHVDRGVIDRVIAYVEASRIPSGELAGAFYYKIYGAAAYTKTSFAINAAALTTLHSAGVYDPTRYARAVRFLDEEYDGLSSWYGDHFYYWYGNYYAAQALHKIGGEVWERYWRKLRDDLLSRQRTDGRWHNDVGPGDEFATAVACLLLRVPDQLLPIFQR